VLRLVEPIERHERRREIFQRRDEGWIQTRGCSKRVDGLAVLTEHIERDTEAVERKGLPRIRRRPRAGQIDRLVPVLRCIVIVAPRNEESLSLACSVAQAERSAGDLGPARRLAWLGVTGRWQR